jgi:fused signal recognition particle receptor
MASARLRTSSLAAHLSAPETFSERATMGFTPPSDKPTASAPTLPPTDSQPTSVIASPSVVASSDWRSRLKAGLSKTVDTLNTPVGELFSGTPATAEVASVAPPVVAQPVAAPISASLPMAPPSSPALDWKARLKAGLARTRDTLNTPVTELFSRKRIDAELLEDLEAALLMADCGVDATQWLLAELKATVKRERIEAPSQLRGALSASLRQLLAPLEQPLRVDGCSPFVIMIAGVNGAGKTTSIGKLAKHYQAQGKKVLLVAGDTFRAAAREQLIAWGERNHVTVIAQESGDPAAVMFDAMHAAKARGIDVVLADTAGRLPTQMHLMDEIAKIRRVIQKVDAAAPHEVLLVLDATLGQNAISQVKAFDKALGVTGLVVTKLDGTAKGGALAAIARQCPKPVRFIGVGEGIDDLQAFKAGEFVDAIFGSDTPVASKSTA